MKPTMAYRLVGSVLVEVHLQDDPSDAEWDAFLAWCVRSNTPAGVTSALVVSDGGSPNARQRKRLVETPGAQNMWCAVVTPSTVSRGAVTALNWLGYRIRAFSLDALDEALAYIRAPEGARAQIVTAVADMKLELAGVTLAQLAPDAMDAPAVAALMDRVARERMASLRARIEQRKGRGPGRG